MYGNRISAECLIPKVLEIFEKDRKVYDGAAYFLEAADWLLCKLTENRSVVPPLHCVRDYGERSRDIQKPDFLQR